MSNVRIGVCFGFRNSYSGFPRSGFGDVAQLGERWLCKPEVAGSTPVVSIVETQDFESPPSGMMEKVTSRVTIGLYER